MSYADQLLDACPREIDASAAASACSWRCANGHPLAAEAPASSRAVRRVTDQKSSTSTTLTLTTGGITLLGVLLSVGVTVGLSAARGGYAWRPAWAQRCP